MYVIRFSGEIGAELSPKWFRAELKKAGGDDIRIDINSPGGSVFAGREIQQAIVDYRGFTACRIIGQAASMASAITSVCDRTTIIGRSILMVHCVSGGTLGNASDHRKTAELLEGIDLQLAQDYSRRSGKPIAEILQLMKNETWFFGREILAAGFADEFEGAEEPENRILTMASAKAQFRATWSQPNDAEIAALAASGSARRLVPLDALWDESFMSSVNKTQSEHESVVILNALNPKNHRRSEKK